MESGNNNGHWQGILWTIFSMKPQCLQEPRLADFNLDRNSLEKPVASFLWERQKTREVIQSQLKPLLLLLLLLLFLLLLLLLLFTHISYPDCSFPFIPSFPTTFPLPQIYKSSVSPQTRAVIPGTSTKHAIICYNNTVYVLSYQGWMRWPVGGKEFHKQVKESETVPDLTVRSSIRIPSSSTCM